VGIPSQCRPKDLAVKPVKFNWHSALMKIVRITLGLCHIGTRLDMAGRLEKTVSPAKRSLSANSRTLTGLRRASILGTSVVCFYYLNVTPKLSKENSPANLPLVSCDQLNKFHNFLAYHERASYSVYLTTFNFAFLQVIRTLMKTFFTALSLTTVLCFSSLLSAQTFTDPADWAAEICGDVTSDDFSGFTDGEPIEPGVDSFGAQARPWGTLDSGTGRFLAFQLGPTGMDIDIFPDVTNSEVGLSGTGLFIFTPDLAGDDFEGFCFQYQGAPVITVFNGTLK